MAAENGLKLLLFDIDGTLMTTRGTVGQFMNRAIEEICQAPVVSRSKDFAGMTDRQIVRNLMQRSAIQPEAPETVITRVIETYLFYLEEGLSTENIQVLPGVQKLLMTLSEQRQFALGVVTGNFRRGALIKLAAAGLKHFFPFGAFGCDAVDRNLLPPIAIARAQNILEKTFSPKDVWIIGDTPNDIECAKSNDLRSLAVATGWWKFEKLEAYTADILLKDLADTEQVLEIFNRNEI